MLQTPKLLNTRFCTLFADSSGQENRQLAVRASMCINDLLSGHLTLCHPLAWLGLVLSSLASLDTYLTEL